MSINNPINRHSKNSSHFVENDNGIIFESKSQYLNRSAHQFLFCLQRTFDIHDNRIHGSYEYYNEWLDDYEGDLVCTKMIAEECLQLRDAPKFKLREIADVMRNSIVGWVATQKTHRFNVYGPQKAWERVQHKADENGFMRVPEQMELPFD